MSYLGRPGMSLSVSVATWNCSIFKFSLRMCVAAPAWVRARGDTAGVRGDM